MDYFTKNKMLFWCVLILVLLNIIILTSFWLKKPSSETQKGHIAKMDGGRIMRDRLQLSDEQAQQFDQIRNEHFMRTRPLQDQMHKIRLDLLDGLFSSETDEVKMQTMLNELGDMQMQFDKNLYQHFEELKEACNETQTKELKYMLIDLIERTRPRDPEHHRPEHPEGFEPNRKPPRQR